MMPLCTTANRPLALRWDGSSRRWAFRGSPNGYAQSPPFRAGRHHPRSSPAARRGVLSPCESPRRSLLPARCRLNHNRGIRAWPVPRAGGRSRFTADESHNTTHRIVAPYTGRRAPRPVSVSISRRLSHKAADTLFYPSATAESSVFAFLCVKFNNSNHFGCVFAFSCKFAKPDMQTPPNPLPSITAKKIPLDYLGYRWYTI